MTDLTCPGSGTIPTPSKMHATEAKAICGECRQMIEVNENRCTHRYVHHYPNAGAKLAAHVLKLEDGFCIHTLCSDEWQQLVAEARAVQEEMR
jgi:hypothetical protein